jgi:putative ABC transport system ATP-binding protein
MSLEIADLHYGYCGATVLKAFSLSLHPGEQALLLGPSGSGKTTLIYLICGLMTPDRGEVRIAGERMSALRQAQRDALRRKHIGVVFQTLRLVSALSVRANLLLAQNLSGRKSDKAEADALLERLGVAHRAGAKPGELSQGEAQRAAIARALVARPSLLIADEPTSALDDASTENVVRLLKDAAAAHGSMLLIATHDARLKAHVPRSIELTSEAR